MAEPNLRVDYYGEHDGEKFQFGIDFNLTDGDLRQPVDDLYKRILKPAFTMLLDKIDRRCGRPDSTQRVIAAFNGSKGLGQ